MKEWVGQQLGNYRLIRLLGQGCFADVYLGEHIYLKTLAAVKVLQVRLTEDNLNSFLAEARTIANLKHPHIVRVLDFGVDGSTPSANSTPEASNCHFLLSFSMSGRLLPPYNMPTITNWSTAMSSPKIC